MLWHAEQDSDNIMYPVAAGSGYSAGQLVFDVFNARFGSGVWSVAVLFIFHMACIMYVPWVLHAFQCRPTCCCTCCLPLAECALLDLHELDQLMCLS